MDGRRGEIAADSNDLGIDGWRRWNDLVVFRGYLWVEADDHLMGGWVGRFAALASYDCFVGGLARIACRSAAVGCSASAHLGCTGAFLGLFQCLGARLLPREIL